MYGSTTFVLLDQAGNPMCTGYKVKESSGLGTVEKYMPRLNTQLFLKKNTQTTKIKLNCYPNKFVLSPL